jgi:hypothetical protein
VARFTPSGMTTLRRCSPKVIPNPNDVKDDMGHADIRTTMRYTHAIPNDRREAVNRATLAHLRRSAVFLEGKLLQTN